MLDLSKNKIGDIGAKQLAESLRNHEVRRFCLISVIFYIIFRH